jgi:cell division protein FtsB
MPRSKKPTFILIAILVTIAAFFFYFPSYSRYRELKSEAEKLEAQVKVMQAQIEALQKEKQLIKTDKNYLETVIRKELGLVEPGEVVYEFEKKPVRKASTAPRAASASTSITQTVSKQASSKPLKTA